MRKSVWIELIEWSTLALVLLFFVGVVLRRGEITAPPNAGSTAPIESVDE